MKRKIILIFLFLIITVNQSFSQQRLRDYFFMVDVSGSMVGKGDGKGINVFDDVKKWIKDFIAGTKYGELIAIFPFDTGLKIETGKYFKRLIKSDSDKNDAYKFIDNLKAEGQNTWLTDSYATLLNRIKILHELIENYDKSQRDQVILIYTDGKGNGPLDNNIDNFIEKYKLIKNDYENLLTKFIVVGDIDVQIDKKDKNKLEYNGINVTVTGRNNVSRITNLNVKPNSLICYNYNPKVTLQFTDVPENLLGEQVDVKILFDESIPCIYDYKPKNIVLGGTNIFEFEIDIVETEQFLRFLSKEKIDTLKGKLLLNPKSNLITIYPTSNIQLDYLFEPVTIKFSPLPGVIKTDGDEIKLGFDIKNNEYLKNQYEINLTGKLIGKPDLKIELEPSKIILSNKIDTLFVSIKKDDNISSIINNINKEYLDTLELNANLILENPNVKLDNSKFKYPISFNPIRKPILLYILIAIIIAALLLYAICKMKSARFPNTAKFIQYDGTTIGFLKGKFCKSYLTLGNTPKDDLKISIPGLNESFIKIIPLPGFSLRIISINPKIKLEMPDSTPADNIVIMPENNFYLLYETNKIEIIYQK